MRTLLLDTITWDLVLDINSNIAVASSPYSLAQDAASAIRLFQGELFYNTSAGVPYFTDVLGKLPPLGLLKEQFIAAALTVPEVTAAKCFISGFSGRRLTGQIQTTDETGITTAASF